MCWRAIDAQFGSYTGSCDSAGQRRLMHQTRVGSWRTQRSVELFLMTVFLCFVRAAAAVAHSHFAHLKFRCDVFRIHAYRRELSGVSAFKCSSDESATTLGLSFES